MNKDISMMKAAKDNELKRLESIASGGKPDNGVEGCPFCEIFLNDDCSQCPVYLKTGYDLCRLSPYADWVRHQSEVHYKLQPPYTVQCDSCREILQRVFEFVKSAPLFMEDQLDIFKVKNNG